MTMMPHTFPVPHAFFPFFKATFLDFQNGGPLLPVAPDNMCRGKHNVSYEKIDNKCHIPLLSSWYLLLGLLIKFGKKVQRK